MIAPQSHQVRLSLNNVHVIRKNINRQWLAFFRQQRKFNSFKQRPSSRRVQAANRKHRTHAPRGRFFTPQISPADGRTPCQQAIWPLLGKQEVLNIWCSVSRKTQGECNSQGRLNCDGWERRTGSGAKGGEAEKSQPEKKQ